MQAQGKRALRLLAVVGLSACAGRTVALVEPTYQVYQQSAADRACVRFYRDVDSGVEQDYVSLRRFADAVDSAGHSEAATLIYDLTDEFEASQFGDPMDDEVAQANRFAMAGQLLVNVGAKRCADLAEVWGIGGYRGQPTASELFEQQRSVWEGSGVRDYKMLVGIGRSRLSTDRQIHVEIVDGKVVAILDAMTGVEMPPEDAAEFPLTVTQVYDRLGRSVDTIDGYDLVYGVPRSGELSNGDYLRVEVSEDNYPAPMSEVAPAS